jgi:phosphatidate cytidylyltransferase
MFWKRAISAIILIPIVVFLVWRGEAFYSTLIVAVTVLMLIEFCQLTQSIGAKGSRILVIVSGLLFCSSAIQSIGFKISIQHALALTLFLAFAYQIFLNQINVAFLSVASTLVGAIYIGWAFGYHLISLRHIGNAVDKQMGSELTFFLLVIVWCGDAAAYFFGRWFGKHKLRPQVSPGKTVEGTIAGVGSGVLAGLCVWPFLLKDTLSLPHVLILGVVLGVMSQISDLSESIIKRGADVKDSGRLIPGHGGLLDRCDSLIFSAPTLYYYFKHLIL